MVQISLAVSDLKRSQTLPPPRKCPWQPDFKGNPINTNGDLPTIGETAPDFKLVTADLKDVTLADFAAKKKLLNIVPSLDTSVCALSTRKFNEHAKAHPDTVILIISADLPFARNGSAATRG